MDIGTGDGRAVLLRASREPGALIVGLDASATAMRESSARADRRVPRNAVFLAAGAEALPTSALAGTADLVTVQFPWGSLLRGALGLEAMALAGIASAVAPGGRVEVLASVVATDGVAGMPTLTEDAGPAIAAAWCAAGLVLESMGPATAEQVAASGSTWARRLLINGGPPRPVWRLTGSR